MAEQMNSGILVAGHLSLDYAPDLSGFRRLLGSRQPEELRPLDYFQGIEAGKLYQISGLDVHLGGCVSNVGKALGHFGTPTRLVARAGVDYHAALIQAQFQELGLEVQLHQAAGASSSTTLILNLPGCDRIFWHDPGANTQFTGAEIRDEDLAWASIFHFGYPPLLPHFYKNPRQLAQLFARAKAQNCQTALDLVAIEEGQEAAQADWHYILAEALPLVDYFLPSFEELASLIWPERYRDCLQRAQGGDICAQLSWEEDIYPLARRGLELGCQELLLKCGQKGLCLAYRDPTGRICYQQQEALPPKQLVSATGAGDTAIAAFLRAKLEGLERSSCLGLAALAGSHAVEAVDSLARLPHWAELQKEWAELEPPRP